MLSTITAICSMVAAATGTALALKAFSFPAPELRVEMGSCIAIVNKDANRPLRLKKIVNYYSKKPLTVTYHLSVAQMTGGRSVQLEIAINAGDSARILVVADDTYLPDDLEAELKRAWPSRLTGPPTFNIILR